MKTLYIASASSLVLALAFSSQSAFAQDWRDRIQERRPPHLQKHEDLADHWYQTQVPSEELQAEFEAAPWEGNCGEEYACSSRSLQSQWEKPRPKTKDPYNDIYNREYQVGYRKYLDANLSNNPVPTPISEGTWVHRYQWEDGYRIPKDDI